MRLTRPGIQTVDVHTFLITAPTAAVPASGTAFRLGVSVEPDVLAPTRMRAFGEGYRDSGYVCIHQSQR